MALNVGQKLGPYEILSAIGAGGMGEVYRARDERLKREVAIKVLPAAYSADPERLRRFEQEAQAAGALNHPNITAVHDFGSHDGAPYIVTELLEGETLRSRLAGGPFTPRRAIGHALQIAQGLAAAHDKGIVHRDLKPENVFVTNDGRVKILDFGLAKLTQPDGLGASATNLPTASPETEPGRVMGTVGYMSPEQVRGKFTDVRSDIFAFGAILYEMLAGKRAFHGDTAADTMSAILTKDPPDLSETNRRVPDALDRIVRHCLEKTPEARFQSASDVAFNLEALSGAPRISGSQPAARSRPARRIAISLAAGLLLIALGAAGAWILAGRRGPAEGSHPSFTRLTFRRGFINNAAFAPDGETIVYSAGWDGKPTELFSTRVGAAESRSLGILRADILSISATGEMLVLRRDSAGPGTLARAPLAGGSARDILENVTDADWSPDGKDLAIIRWGGEQDTVESPIGKVLYKAPGFSSLRVSRRGDRIAVAEWSGNANGGSISVVDLFGSARKLTDGWDGLGWVRWSPDEKEVWFRGVKVKVGAGIYAVDLAGKVRSVFETPTAVTINDITKNGRAVLSNHTWRSDIFWSRPGLEREQEASWLDWSLPLDLSNDGKTLLFHELREGGGQNGFVYIRRDPAEPPVRLAEGYANGLSPDGKWALIRAPASGTRPSGLMLVPTGPGEPKTLVTEPVGKLNDGFWMPDGKRVLFRGAEAGKGARIYVLDIERGPPQPITPEGKADGYMPPSPDGRRIAVAHDEKIWIYPIGEGEARPLAGDWANGTPVRWSPDGRSLFVWTGTRVPGQIWRVDVESGAKTLWKEIAPSDVTGVEKLNNVIVSADGRSYAYSLERRWSDLYVVEGLK